MDIESALSGKHYFRTDQRNDLNKLRSIGKDIAQIVEDTKGTQNISNGSEETTPDLHVVVDRKEKGSKKWFNSCNDLSTVK